VYSFRGGGAEKMMVQIANELQRRSHDVELILVTASGPYESLVDPGIRTTEIGGSNTLEIQYHLWRNLRKDNTDVLLSTMEIPNIVSVIATAYPNPIPVVLRSANINSMKERHGKYKLIPIFKRLMYPRADAIITISDGVARDLADVTGIIEDEMTTIYNPAYNPAIPTKAQEPVDMEWMNDEKKRVAIGVGHMKPQKDFATLIRATHRINTKEDLYLVILGEGELENDLKSLAEKLEIRDRVHFPGFVNNPYAYMKKADIFVLSSAWEGFGNVIVEAMACGTPAVCTNCPGGPAEILSDGEYGPLVPVGDEEAMATAIRDVLADPINSSELQSRAKDFAIEPIVDQYEELLHLVTQ
jgi:glycosyltransferase involved in cell wall biosynthesis